MALTVPVEVPPRDREVLGSWTRSSSIRAGLAQRARIVLLAANGVGTNEISRRVGVSKPTVIAWKRRYVAEGVGGLEDRPKAGRPRTVDEAEVVAATLEPPPDHGPPTGGKGPRRRGKLLDEHGEDYDALNSRCAELTTSEVEILGWVSTPHDRWTSRWRRQ